MSGFTGEEKMNSFDRRRFLTAAGVGVIAAAGSFTVLRDVLAAGKIKPTDADALLVEGDLIVPLINQIARSFSNVVLTQDWHTADHVSFASQHPGKKPFEAIKLDYGTQVLWPDHCVQGTEGAQIHSGINIPQAQLMIRKGYHRDVDSYSGFLEADRKTETGLAGYLTGRKIKQVFVCGLATDYCVAWSALDARKFGFQASVIEDACRGIDINGSVAAAWKDMTAAGVKKIQSTDFA
jgi:nicotinamidase/pyrazinamidase